MFGMRSDQSEQTFFVFSQSGKALVTWRTYVFQRLTMVAIYLQAKQAEIEILRDELCDKYVKKYVTKLR